MSKKDIHTVSSKSGSGWDNKQNGKTISHSEIKSDAVKLGKDQAKQSKSEHVIHNKDGKISEKNSYGNDTNPPKDKK